MNIDIKTKWILFIWIAYILKQNKILSSISGLNIRNLSILILKQHQYLLVLIIILWKSQLILLILNKPKRLSCGCYAREYRIFYSNSLCFFCRAINLCCYFHKLSSVSVKQAAKNRVPASDNNRTSKQNRKKLMIKTNSDWKTNDWIWQ